ncbi:3-carboxyethylcatechol 2,3-dioxygenase [Nocardiopsis sp. HNM0947]|uniref:2,3-dihydroxyphenylpropionate/2,3-dihydroxicinnamic acid 1,2-dioxygenase n=1 Tax=Nocardiopsis coralli TaxID=2772213 RepID=A0ABR9P137_9ACTN|nr:3-carboxyethylcatechol 2,3-dioxygenase [Nocardiopsis coralli]MBE2997527.1 3-carboxyethylcatechol 2,3-dioxygenase [Nocardiopsis coralli]
MPVALVGLSHSPLMGTNQPADETVQRVDAALEEARAFVRDFDPDLVVLYAPDHYNGFFYEKMPPFCLGTSAESVGDFGSEAGPLRVDTEAAKTIAGSVLEQDVDLTISARMKVDHGFVQPLEVLFGGIDTVDVVPVYINGVASPLGPVRRVRALGEAIGRAAADLDRRVLFLASGGLSHDPPVPVLEGAPPKVADALIEGTPPTPEQRARGEKRVLQGALDYVAGTSGRRELNPEWDRLVLDTLGKGDLDRVDTWTNAWFEAEGGGSAHEVRTWIAAHASLSAQGSYTVRSRFYEAIPEWIAGFAVTTAAPDA